MTERTGPRRPESRKARRRGTPDSPSAPKVFVSYSWDDATHKEWVLKFATRLQEDGIQVILDRWHLPRGGDKAVFMERSIGGSDFVILVCTPAYAKRANERTGGVGYEAMVITGKLAEKIDDQKFIPILRAGDFESALPSWIKTKFGVDLRGDVYREEEYSDLLKTLFREPAGLRLVDSVYNPPKQALQQPFTENAIQMSLATKKDCKALHLAPKELIEFALGEATRHPGLFTDRFTSLPLVFHDNVVLASWDGSHLTLERVLNRAQAYPVNDAWTASLALYRKATLLAYRSAQPGQVRNPHEIRKALSFYRRLVATAGDFLKLLRDTGQDPPDVYQDLNSLIEEAEFALANEAIGTSVARLEAVLSTVHKLILRYAPQQSPSVRETSKPTREIRTIGSGQGTVLLVDDELIWLDVLSGMLSSRGFAVTATSDTTTAMRALVEQEFDLVITDLIMPGSDGREVARAAKKSSDKTKVIVITGYAAMSKLADLFRAGVDDVILKVSFTSESLLTRINALLSGTRTT